MIKNVINPTIKDIVDKTVYEIVILAKHPDGATEQYELTASNKIISSDGNDIAVSDALLFLDIEDAKQHAISSLDSIKKEIPNIQNVEIVPLILDTSLLDCELTDSVDELSMFNFVFDDSMDSININ